MCSLQLLEVIALSALRNDLDDGIITLWDSERKIGVIDDKVFFSALTCDFPFVLEEGTKVYRFLIFLILFFQMLCSNLGIQNYTPDMSDLGIPQNSHLQ